MLLPRELDMVEAGKTMPLPLAKPANIAEEGKKEAARPKPRRKTKKQRCRRSRSRQAVRSPPTASQGDPTRPSRTGRERSRNMTRRAAAGRAAARLSDDERTLWHDVTRSIAPLKRDAGVEPRRARNRRAARKPPPEAKAEADSRHASQAQPHRRGRWRRPRPNRRRGLRRSTRRQKQRLARGTEPIDARIDLHGCTQSEAHAALLRFLHRAQARGRQTSCW